MKAGSESDVWADGCLQSTELRRSGRLEGQVLSDYQQKPFPVDGIESADHRVGEL